MEDTSALFPIETNAESPSPRSYERSSTARPSAPLCDEKPDVSRRNASRPERRIESRPGYGDPEAVRADQARTVGADEREQPFLALGAFVAGLGEARRDHAQRLDACAEGSFGCADHGFTGKADDREVDACRNLLDRVIAGDAGDRLSGTVHRVGDAREVLAQDVSEELTSNGSTPGRGAEDRNRRGGEEGPKRLRDGDMITLVYPGKVRLGRSDLEADLQDPALELPLDVEARIREHPRHRPVVRHHLRHEPLDPELVRTSRELLEQTGSKPVPLQFVGNGERDLGSRDVTQTRVARERDDPLLPLRPRDHTDVRPPVVPVRLDERLCQTRPDLRGSVEALVEAPLGEAGEELEHGLDVRRMRRAQTQRPAVTQKDVVDVDHGVDSLHA